MQPPCIIHRLYREECGVRRDERDLGEEHVVNTQRQDGVYACSDKCPMLAVLGPASGDLWHPLLTRLGLMNMDMVQDLIQAAHPQPNDWCLLWLERMDTLVISTPLQVIATKLFSNQTLGETWMDLVDRCYGQAYASPDAWTAETASFTKIPFVRSSFMSGSAIYEHMKVLSGQCRHFQRTSEGSEYTGPDEDYESTLAEWAGKARDGVYLMDLPLD